MFFKMLFAMRVTHVTPCALPVHGKQHWQHPKNYKHQKLRNNMKGDTEHSTVQGSKDKEIDLIRKSSKEKQKKTWSKEEINTVAEELVSSGKYR